MKTRNIVILALISLFTFSILLFASITIFSVSEQWSSELNETDENPSTSQTSSTEASECETSVIEITSGSADSATIQQISGTQGIGEITVTWMYENSAPVMKSTAIDTPRGDTTVENSKVAELEEIIAEPSECDGIRVRYPER